MNKNGIGDAKRTLADDFDLSSLLVLLVDGNTASAAKVMTAVLRENKCAVVAGEKTFLLRRAKAKLREQLSGSCDRQRQPRHYPTIIWLACRHVYRGCKSGCHRELRVRERHIKEVAVTNS